MKKVFLTMIVLFVSVMLSSCFLFGSMPWEDDEDSGNTVSYDAPDVVSSGELAALGASDPADKADALAIVNGAVTDLMLMKPAFYSADSVRGAFNTSWSMDWAEEGIGGGRVDFSGQIRASEIDNNSSMTDPMANTHYDQIFAETLNSDYFGTISTVSTDSGAYEISGRMSVLIDLKYDTDVITSDDPADFSMDHDFSMGCAWSLALSVRDTSTGRGGKFIVTQGFFVQEDDIATTDADGFSALKTDQLSLQTVVMSVYNDSNILVAGYTVSPLDITFLGI